MAGAKVWTNAHGGAAPILVVRGSGHQALPQVAAVAAVRGLKRVRVFSPTPEHRGKFVELLKSKYDFEAA